MSHVWLIIINAKSSRGAVRSAALRATLPRRRYSDVYSKFTVMSTRRSSVRAQPASSCMAWEPRRAARALRSCRPFDSGADQSATFVTENAGTAVDCTIQNVQMGEFTADAPRSITASRDSAQREAVIGGGRRAFRAQRTCAAVSASGVLSALQESESADEEQRLTSVRRERRDRKALRAAKPELLSTSTVYKFMRGSERGEE